MNKINHDILQQRLDAGISIPAIAKEFCCSRQAIHKYMHAHDLTPKAKPYQDIKWLKAQKKAGRSDEDIAKECGVSPGVIIRLRKRHGIGKAPSNHIKFDADRRWMLEQKLNGRTDADIGAELGCTVHTVRKIRRRLGVSVFSRSQGAKD